MLRTEHQLISISRPLLDPEFSMNFRKHLSERLGKTALGFKVNDMLRMHLVRRKDLAAVPPIVANSRAAARRTVVSKMPESFKSTVCDVQLLRFRLEGKQRPFMIGVADPTLLMIKEHEAAIAIPTDADVKVLPGDAFEYQIFFGQLFGKPTRDQALDIVSGLPGAFNFDIGEVSLVTGTE